MHTRRPGAAALDTHPPQGRSWRPQQWALPSPGAVMAASAVDTALPRAVMAASAVDTHPPQGRS